MKTERDNQIAKAMADVIQGFPLRGVPAQIRTDNGSAHTSRLLQDLKVVEAEG